MDDTFAFVIPEGAGPSDTDGPGKGKQAGKGKKSGKGPSESGPRLRAGFETVLKTYEEILRLQGDK